ncbi:MAG: PPC domain-containing protein [Planctomycetes bacterium]|nr:PPC domain-containing protein [Planctomycetota bacterium]
MSGTVTSTGRCPGRALRLLAALAACSAAVAAQAAAPRIGYAYPAGLARGSSVEIVVGGRALGGVSAARISGADVQAEVLGHERPLTGAERETLRQELQKLLQTQAGRTPSPADAARIAELRRKLATPRQPPSPQIAETVRLRITAGPDAEPTVRDLRLRTPAGWTNPIRFRIGTLSEYRETEPNQAADTAVPTGLPLLVNGQILPGDVDRFWIRARKGARLVVVVSARELIPYLADAVPGWFQAVVSVSDARGNLLAFADDHRFDPDPVLHCDLPADGDYVVEVRDALWRGREDFVYRMAIGEVPLVTGVFPLGARAGAEPTVELQGVAVPEGPVALPRLGRTTGVRALPLGERVEPLRAVPFAVDDLPEVREADADGSAAGPQDLQPPVIVNGRIAHPGERDLFRFRGRAGERVVAEVMARRLGSPLDARLRLLDAQGRTLASNDDQEDRGAGWTTHHADPYLAARLPADGTYLVEVLDVQDHGGPEYAYRLRVSPPRHDFALRVVPATLNLRAGATEVFTVHAMRRDGFDEDIRLRLVDPPPGLTLGGAWVPAGSSQARLTLTAPANALDAPLQLVLEGVARIGGKDATRVAVPAENQMQAFAYQHLVPAAELVVAVLGGGRGGAGVRLASGGDAPVRLPAQGKARVPVRGLRRALPAEVRFELSDPPAGIALEGIEATRDGFDLLVTVDGQKVRPGTKGNLIVQAFGERTGPAREGARARTQRFALGTLPAIPFEVGRR